jgi:2-oxoglutarate ferredoxin oxidoreductase subunit gamma
MAKFEPLLTPGGLLVVNTSLIEALPRRTDVEIVEVPCTALARAAGADRLVSIVALGALLARRPIVTPDSVRQALTEMAGHHHPELLGPNLEAFASGLAGARAATSRT